MEPEFTPFLNPETRRSFLKKTAIATAAVAGARLIGYGAQTGSGGGAQAGATPRTYNGPWYRNVQRWGQTDITEIDPTRYDVQWWRQYWRDTRVQGVIISAGGIAAYYQSQIVPGPNHRWLHRHADYLGTMDLFGTLASAAKDDGLAVLARLDSSGNDKVFYDMNRDEFTVDINNNPYILRDLYVPCINGEYFSGFMPTVMQEILGIYKKKYGFPDGFVDNNWIGLPREYICYCENCKTLFIAYSGLPLPQKKDWEDTAYRKWIQWSYLTRLQRWDANNAITRGGGGNDCLWVGMNDASVTNEAETCRDLREICHRSEIVMRDDQRRHDATGFQFSGEGGKLMHGVLGWNKLVAGSTAMFDQADAQFRLETKPPLEARMWAVDGMAGGDQPWWHFIAAYQEDRRMFLTPVQLWQWHQLNAQFLTQRAPLATVGVVWSQLNNDFFGRDDPDLMVNLPQRGITQSLIRARIPYIMIHADDIPSQPGPEGLPGSIRLLILPNLGVMTDPQVMNVRSFFNHGGSVFATELTSLFDQWGDPRPNFALADLFHSHLGEEADVRTEAGRVAQANETIHSYLRLTPALGSRVYGPHIDGEASIESERHPVLDGFDETDIIAFGGTLYPSTVDPDIIIKPLTYIPALPSTPPEEVYMRDPRSDANALILTEEVGGARMAYLPADLDRRYAQDNQPDHSKLLINIVRWALNDPPPLLVNGPGFLDCHLYQQIVQPPAQPILPGQPVPPVWSPCLILHLVNLSNAGTWRGPTEELMPVGPLDIRIQIPKGFNPARMNLLVAGVQWDFKTEDKWIHFILDTVVDHEIVVVSSV